MRIADLLAQGSFGGGFGAGIGAGIAIGVGAGSGAGSGNAKKKLERQLTAAMEAGEISVVNKDGQSMTAESILRLLQEQFKQE